MSVRVDPDLRREMILYGAEDLKKCINCGNCTAVCALSEGDNTFPRKTIRPPPRASASPAGTW